MSESRIAALEAHRQGDKALLEDVADKVDTIASDVQAIRLNMEKQKGFIAGCLFILVPIWGLILAAGAAAYEWWKGQ